MRAMLIQGEGNIYEFDHERSLKYKNVCTIQKSQGIEDSLYIDITDNEPTFSNGWVLG